MSIRALTRSKTDRIVSGVCGGIAASYGFDSVLVRGALVVVAVINLPLASLLYMAAYFFIPEEIVPPPISIEHPGWRFDPWTGDRIKSQGDVIVDTAPSVTTTERDGATASTQNDASLSVLVDENPERVPGAARTGAISDTSGEQDAHAGVATAPPAVPDASPGMDSSPEVPSETDTHNARTPSG